MHPFPHKNNKCHCACHFDSWEYRLFNGSSFEGVSLRVVYYDKKKNIVGWTNEPILTLASRTEEVRKFIVEAMKDLDDMLAATQKPIIDERGLEAKAHNSLGH